MPPARPDFSALHGHGFVRVGVATPAVAVADPERNAAAILQAMTRAADDGVDLLIFPELALSGYAIDDLLLQDALLVGVERALEDLAARTQALATVALIGAPLRRNGRVYNCAVALARGKILGVVPKTFLPNYREYYEKRWFASGAGLASLEIDVAGQTAPFGTDLIFAADDLADFTFHVEICEDYWAPTPPSTQGALAGALILCNLSASNIVIGKAEDRSLLSASQSMRCVAAYAYSAAGAGESTTDLAWDGQGSIHELGELLAQSERFAREPQLIVADVDVQRLRLERARFGTFNDAAALAGHPETGFRAVGFRHQPSYADLGLKRPLRRFPYVPDVPARLDQDCYEAFNIQVHGLVRRFEATRARTMVIGVSGGLDSTQALIVAAKACDLMGLPRTAILGFTMPGFATGEETRANAWSLMRALGVAAEEIDIRPAARQMLADMDHPFARGEPVYDIAFENVQAGLRTDYLFRLANQRNGFVVGTGDLSELALGWCTYGVGDHMSHYAVNAGLPKTLIQHLIRWTVRTGEFRGAAAEVLEAILGTEISPELVPADASGAIQSTQSKIGPYELHDFFLFHILRYGLPPSKVAFLAWRAWAEREAGAWPAGFPEEERRAYDLPTIVRWLEAFITRFFATSQFKRSAMPNGPKISPGGALSPRGDWRAPSDGLPDAWLKELRDALPPR
ncbi:NAD+ synthase (glutamine-hydrolyzing) [Methylopila capsulata]|uniref:Glutamine-dependent NAD(+) synthetase n=1 Tax=Methylopila capsulata TaxID=61654 RepID=A0A9W6MU37_9HYPH|nr:NAD(+) synthase [Methylopila capsulata]MBM7853041.1 NAD+ synthase (glutamine-hydrolyzing) [Methylopila capsulata]GLK57746.1 NAD(+) synthase [Methylopila capsulata]